MKLQATLLLLFLTSFGYAQEKQTLDFYLAKRKLNQAVANYSANEAFTLMLADKDGVFYNQSLGNSSSSKTYRSASTSKLVTSAVILYFVDRGYLNLDDRITKFIKLNNTSIYDLRRKITLRHLLAFTSGLQDSGATFCTYRPGVTTEYCAMNILDNAIGMTATPGTEYYYGSHHMYIAALMTMKALGVNSWEKVFTKFKKKTGLFTGFNYDIPSLTNPRLAGGMHWNGDEYIKFLQKLAFGNLLSSTSHNQLKKVHQTYKTKVIYSPITSLGEQWRYTLGAWNECTTYLCFEGIKRLSSEGAYGAYPFIDYENQYVGIISKEGELSTDEKGHDIVRDLQIEIDNLINAKN